ncbi:RICIN domain-containing protein [Micromonospora pisi]|uniref:RICIN domain-containing protein n=1 Tax=Micromonospora pisi TaxID=589240 RepID=UPI001476EB10|nr:RICIN domain-containing protein [Micromonospora pisi]
MAAPSQAAVGNKSPDSSGASTSAKMRLAPVEESAKAGLARPVGVSAAAVAVYIVDGRDGRCLDADIATIGSNGTKIQLWDCLGATSQMWWATYTATGNGFWTFQNASSGRCLDADRNTPGNGGKVQLWDCQAGAAAQAWWEYGNGVQLYNGFSGRCLDADAATSGGNGTKVQIWNCEANAPAGQSWYFA